MESGSSSGLAIVYLGSRTIPVSRLIKGEIEIAKDYMGQGGGSLGELSQGGSNKFALLHVVGGSAGGKINVT